MKVSATVLSMQITFLIDTGASVNIISGKTFEKFKIKPRLEPPSNFIYAYCSKTPLKVRGHINADIIFKDNSTNACFYVIDSNESHSKDLLSSSTAESLKMIHFPSPLPLYLPFFISLLLLMERWVR